MNSARNPSTGLRSGHLLAIAVLAAAALAGCSIARLAYNNADWLLLREMDVYLDLTAAQKKQAAARLRQQLETHRQTELPDYARYIARVRRVVSDGIVASEADWIVDRGYELVRRTIRSTIPALVPSLVTASDSQLAHMERHMNIVNQEYRDEFLPESRSLRLERRVRRTVTHIERWVGTLRDDQKQLAARLRNSFPDSAEDWLAYNEGKQRALLKLLRAGADMSAVEIFLVRWWVELRGRSPSLERRNQAMLDGIKRLMVSMDATLDDRQRNYLLWRLDDYLEQIEILRRKPG